MVEQAQLEEKIKRELLSNDFASINEPLVRGVKYKLLHVLGPGETGVTWKATNDIGEYFAIKFITPDLYKEGSYLEEVDRVRKLAQCKNIARLEGWDDIAVELPSTKTQHKFICFVTEYIEGDTLREFLNSNDVSPQELHAFVRGVCGALYAMAEHRLQHNDMHDKNIMIAVPGQDGIEEQTRIVKVIDTGSMRSSTRPVTKNLNDHDNFIRHIISFYNRILDQRSVLNQIGKCYMREVKNLLSLMVEDDAQRRLDKPKRIWEEFNKTWARVQSPLPDSRRPRLNTPFDYISAEHIANDKLLARLFSKKCPWYNSVKGPDPICLDGPRGCGKSTVFRMLRLKTLLRLENQNLTKLKEIGFYLSCSSELRSRFAYLGEELARALKADIIHYFNLLIAKEIIESLRIISLRKDRETLFGFSELVEKDIYCFLLQQLSMTEKVVARLNGVSHLDYLMDLIDRELSN